MMRTAAWAGYWALTMWCAVIAALAFLIGLGTIVAGNSVTDGLKAVAFSIMLWFVAGLMLEWARSH